MALYMIQHTTVYLIMYISFNWKIVLILDIQYHFYSFNSEPHIKAFLLSQVRVFTFSVGQHNYDVTPLQWIACANKGECLVCLVFLTTSLMTLLTTS